MAIKKSAMAIKQAEDQERTATSPTRPKLRPTNKGQQRIECFIYMGAARVGRGY